MKLGRILLLALLAGALLAYVFYVEIPQSKNALEKGKLFAHLTSRQIESVSISNKSGSFSLVNTEPVKEAPLSVEGTAESGSNTSALSKWQLQDVKGSELDRGVLNTLLSGLEDLDLQEPIPDSDTEKDLGVYGLNVPEATLNLKSSGGTTEIKLGKKNEYLSKRYLNASGRAGIYLVPETFFSAVSKSRLDFRSKNLLELGDDEIADISLIAPESKIKMQAIGPGKWKIIEPFESDASATAVSGLTMNLRSLRAVDFIDDIAGHFTEYHFDKPDLKVVVNFKESSKRGALEMSISRGAAGASGDAANSPAYVLLQGKPSLYKLESDPIASIFKPLNEFREKQLFQFAVDQVVQLDVEREDAAPLALIKTGEKWTVNGKEADSVFALEALKKLSGLEASSFPVEDRDYGFGAPRLKAIVRFAAAADGKAPKERILVVGAAAEPAVESGKSYFAGADDLLIPFIISQQTLDKITPKEEVLIKSQNAPEPLKPEDPAAAGE